MNPDDIDGLTASVARMLWAGSPPAWILAALSQRGLTDAEVLLIYRAGALLWQWTAP